MSNNNHLNLYLNKLETYLMDISPGDRASIILDIETHISEANNKYPEKTIQQTLKDLGPAEQLANHYRLDKGLKTFKTKKSVSAAKIISIGCFSTVILFCLFIGGLVWKFTPLFQIDEKSNRVVILGGLIDINGKSGKVKIMDQYRFVDNQYANEFNGAIDIPKTEDDEVVINFNSGLLNLTTNIENKLTWNCKLETPPTDDFLNRNKEIVEINFEKFEAVSCDISIPQDTKLTVDAKDAQVNITEPEYDLFVELKNGLVTIVPNPEMDYKYSLKVDKGAVSKFESSKDSDEAFEVSVYIENGTIQNGN